MDYFYKSLKFENLLNFLNKYKINIFTIII